MSPLSECIVQQGPPEISLWDCDCKECERYRLEADDDWEGYDGGDLSPSCSICDGLNHGYPGGPPCPLEG